MQRYRSKDELNQAWQYEPIKRLKTYLMEQGHWSEEDEQTLLESAKVEVEKACRALSEPSPQAPEAAFDYLYESPVSRAKQTA